MRVRKSVPLLGMVLVIAAFAASALAAAGAWHNLKRVTVTVQNGSLPPPYGKAHVTHYTTATQVAKATRALNANHIAKRAAVQNNGCTGGYDATIKAVEASSKTVTLSAYECGGKSYGDVAGNVPGFLHALGISAP